MRSVGRVLAGLISGTAVAAATTSAYPQSCEAILQNGIWETKTITSRFAESRDFKNFLCSAYQRGGSGALRLLAPGVAISAKGDGSSARQYCSSASTAITLSQAFDLQETAAATAIVKAWESCMNSTGNRGSILWGEDPNVFFITLARVAERGAPPQATGRLHYQPNDFRCGIDPVRVGRITPLVRCEVPDRDLDRSLAIDLDPGDPVSFLIPALKREPDAAGNACDMMHRQFPYRICFSGPPLGATANGALRVGDVAGSYIGKYTSTGPGTGYFSHSGPNPQLSTAARWVDGAESDRRVAPSVAPMRPARCNINIWEAPFHADATGRVFRGYASATNPATNAIGRIEPWPAFESVFGGVPTNGGTGTPRPC